MIRCRWASPSVMAVHAMFRRLGRLAPPPEPSAKPMPLPKPEANPQAAGAQGYLGLVGDDRLERGRGIRVLETLPKGPAARAGLRAGDLIVRVEGKPVFSVQYHPEASPGPQDSQALFERFVALMGL